MSFYTSTLHLFKQQLSTHDAVHKIDNKYMGENIAVQECALSASTLITTSSSVRNNGMWRMKDKTIAVKWRFCSVSFLQRSIEGQHTHDILRIIFTGILYSTMSSHMLRYTNVLFLYTHLTYVGFDMSCTLIVNILKELLRCLCTIITRSSTQIIIMAQTFIGFCLTTILSYVERLQTVTQYCNSECMGLYKQ